MLIEILIGALIGFLSGLFGLGGSSIATPLLKTFANIKPIFALATPLLLVLPTAISGTIAYYKSEMINFKIAKQTIVAGSPFVILGALLTKFVSGKFLMLSTGIFILFVSLTFIFRKKFFTASEETPTFSNVKTTLAGIAIGLVSGFLANGGGIMLVPAYVKFLKMDIKMAMATSLFVVSFFALPGAITHIVLKHVDFRLFLTLLFPALFFSYIGAKVALKLKSETLEKFYGFALSIFSIFFIARAIF